MAIPSLTTATSATQALPDGQLEVTSSSRPVRARTATGWQALNATLRQVPGGTWSPKVSTEAVTISNGGTGPLATMTSPGRTLSLYWPGKLPRPTVSGDTAVYPAVLPGTDLRVTVDVDGGIRDVLIVHDRTAAANPALRHLTFTTQMTGGLKITTGPGGTLQAATPGGAPAFTAPAPVMWDSAATTPAPNSPRAAGARPAASAFITAAPAASTADQPGARAHTAAVKASISALQGTRAGVTRQALALIPDAAMLTSPATVYPAYVDPTWLNTGGSRGWYASDDDEFASTNYYDNTADPGPDHDLQVGYDGTFNAHSFVDMRLNSSDLKGAVINSAVIQFTEETSWSCTPEPVELWQVGAPPTVSSKPWVSWNNEPAWEKYTGTGAVADGAIASVPAAHGYSGCAAAPVTFDISDFMKAKGPAGPSDIAFGLKAPDLNNDLEWKEFSNAAGAITMTTYYDHAPSPERDSEVSPGGACQDASPARTIVGNDDFTLMTTPSDGDGDSLTLHFVVTNYGSTTPLVNVAKTAPSGQPASIEIPRSQVQGWHSDGASTAYAYSWYAYAIDPSSLSNQADTGPGTQATPCLFTYDPTAPQAPGVAPPSASADGSLGSLGGTASFTFANCTTLLDPTPTACTGNAPSNYDYQVDDGPEKTLAVSGTSQAVSIPLSQVGPNAITVTAVSAAGNPSETTSASFDVDPPATAYGDADYAGTGHPDLITVGDGTGRADEPGLWMALSDGSGNLSTPVDIGARGTGLATEGSPADWVGALALHGDFTGHHVQDVVAYFPTGSSAGTMQMIGGPGTATALAPESGNTQAVLGGGSPLPPGSTNPLGDYNLDGAQDTPIDLVAAGNASLTGNPLPDLIGILGDSVNGYELNIYTAGPGAFASAYGNPAIAASTSMTSHGPDGNPWGPNWTLEAAQPSGAAVLFAYDKANGQLWESTNPTQSASASALVGMPGSIWKQVTGSSWGPTAVLSQADVNAAGNVELWTVSGATATSWTLPPPSSTASDTTIPLTQGPANTRVNPGHEWPLSDGPLDATAGSASLIDTESSSGNATPSTGVTFTDSSTDNDDPIVGPVATFTGSSSTSLTLPAGILQDATSSHAALHSMTLTMRFLAEPGAAGILAGSSTGSLAAKSASSAPIAYIGTDGHLYAQFPSAHIDTSNGVVAQDIAPLVSPARVDDGLWHTVTLVADGTAHDQVLYLDNNVPLHLWDNGYIDSATPATVINPGQTTSTQAYGLDQVTIGAGVFSPAGWVNADATTGAKGTARASYFTGQVSDVVFYPSALSLAQLPHSAPRGVNTVINSGVQSSQCIELADANKANGTAIQINTCNGAGYQRWVIQPTGAIMYASDNSYCVNVTGNGTALGTLIDLNTCNGSTGQAFQVLSNGSLMNPHSGKCIDDPGSSTTPATQLQLYTCNGGNAQAWASTVRPAQLPQVGTIVSTQSGLCIQNAGGSPTSPGSTTSPSTAQTGTCNGYLSQQLTINGDGTITVAGLCLNNSGGFATNGNPVNFNTCNGTGAQQWAHPDTGALENFAAGMCIQGTTTAGAGLQLWNCDENAHQTWVDSSTWNH